MLKASPKRVDEATSRPMRSQWSLWCLTRLQRLLSLFSLSRSKTHGEEPTARELTLFHLISLYMSSWTSVLTSLYQFITTWHVWPIACHCWWLPYTLSQDSLQIWSLYSITCIHLNRVENGVKDSQTASKSYTSESGLFWIQVKHFHPSNLRTQLA